MSLADDRGLSAAAYTATIAVSMILFVLCANVLAAQYGRGVVRGALDEGVRMGSRAGAGSAVCEQHISDALGQLLAGSMGHVDYRCRANDDVVTAAADVTFRGWLPAVPDLTYTARASSRREPEVAP